MKVYIKTYGCAANRSESEIMAGILSKAGYSIVSSEDQADIIILNTCHVKLTTEQKILHKISQISKPLIVAGCMPEAYPEKVRAANPRAVLLSTHQIFRITEAIEKRKDFLGKSRLEKLCIPRLRNDSNIAIVQIAEGCLGNCAYCATRLAKGKLFSFRPSKIIKEIDYAIKSGCKEVWLTAQDTAAYGADIGFDLPQLLYLLPEGDYSIRIGMMNPSSVLPILDKLIEAYKDDKIVKFLHLPVQSGDNEILKRMNRPYLVEDFERIVNAFRAEFPNLIFWTDIIVGYPGETEEQFQNTLKLIERIKPNKVNVSRYSKRDGTPAARLKQINTKELKRRSKLAAKLLLNLRQS